MRIFVGGQHYGSIQDDRIKSFLGDYYGLIIKHIYELELLTDNHIYLIQTHKDEYFIFKVFEKYIPDNQCYYEDLLIQKMKDLWNIPKPILSKKDSYISSFSGKKGILYTFLEGENFQFGNLHHLQQIAEALANFHQNNKDILTIFKKDNHKSDLLLLSYEKEDYALFKEQGYESIGKLFLHLTDVLKKSSNLLEETIVHGSITSGSISLKEGHLHLFDSETIGYGYALYELAFSMYNLSYNKVKGTYLSAEDMISFFDAYQKIFTISENERSLLYPLILFSFIMDFGVMLKERHRKGTKGFSNNQLHVHLGCLATFMKQQTLFNLLLKKI